MRFQVPEQAPVLAVFFVMLIAVASFSLAFQQDLAVSGSAGAPIPAETIALPGPGEDQDRDGYADAVDRVDGDGMVALTVDWSGPGREPYAVLETQDDQWRFGAGRALEWRHVVDPDPLGHKPGGPAWQERVLRTGAHWVHDLDPDDPTMLLANIRDDADSVTLVLEVYDRAADPHASLGSWTVTVDLVRGHWRVAETGAGSGVGPVALDEPLQTAGVSLVATVTTDLSMAEKEVVADRWAPVLHFADEEPFRPTSGAALERFHGFFTREPDLRTWTLSFNNGRDTYRLLLADFNGDGRTDHQDVVILTDILRGGETAPDEVQAQVTRSHDGRVVVQYWFLTFYNFVLDESGAPVDRFAHAGDREFIQLVFADHEAARSGRPDNIAYSQHYGGIRIDDPDEPWLWHNDTHPHVYVAHGSHASYPVPGDDSRLRRSFLPFADRFLGDGEQWTSDDYTTQIIADQPWHLGYKWGPATRHHRDLGTTGQPLLQYDFQYPFLDPLRWADSLSAVSPDRLHEIYSTPQELRP